MGNHKFRLSDMMPNAWFYKLIDMSKRASTTPHHSNHRKMKDKEKKQKQQQKATTLQRPQQTPSRKSYHITRTNGYPNSVSHSKSSSTDSLFPDPQTQSNKTSSSSSLQFRYPYNSMDSVVWTAGSDLAPPPTPSQVEQELRSDHALLTESSSSDHEPRNIVIDIDETKQLSAKIENSEDFVTIFDLELRPIVTKAARPADSKKVKSHKTTTTPRYHNSETERRQSASKGLKMRKANSPRINNGRRKSVSSSKKSALAESLAIVKRSKNPEEDFKQSMVEMIVEHEIRSSKDLEELLACYLSLNSDEYHDMIIGVFKQIWCQLSSSSNNKMMTRRPIGALVID